MKNFIGGFVLGAFLFGGGFAVARTYYDIDDVMSKLDDIESGVSDINSTVMLWCD